MRRIKVFEIALCIGVVCAIASGAWARNTQRDLADKLVRLHVVANSDSRSDQELKLQVRDRTLATADGLIASASDSADAARILSENLPYIRREAQAEVALRGLDYPVAVTLDTEEFPTRDYDGFSLPAGRYQTLRVTIGEGTGRNWWCVLFPPLCEAAATNTLENAALKAGLSDRQVALITEQEGFRIKFRCVELWNELMQREK